jgi:hypothetical protein
MNDATPLSMTTVSQVAAENTMNAASSHAVHRCSP